MISKLYAIVAADFTPWGGMERPNYELAWYLAEHAGAEVHLVSHRVASPLADHPLVKMHLVPRPFGRPTFGSPYLDRMGRKVAGEISGVGGSVVVNGGNCLWNDVNWIHYVHNTPIPEYTSAPLPQREWIRWKRRRDQRRERWAVGESRLIITNSDLMKERLNTEVGIDPGRMRTIYLAIDPEQFRPSNSSQQVDARRALGLPVDRPLVAFVGGLGFDRRKGFDILFDAWRQCCLHADWDATLVVAGTGGELPHWKRRVGETGRDRDMCFLGFTKQVSTVLAAADVLVSPTRFEPYGHGVHEAICCGLPVFVTRCAGVAERFPADLQDLLLDDPPDSNQLCQRLLDWNKDIDGYRQRVQPFSERLRSRTWTDMAADFVNAMTESRTKARP